MTDNPPPLADSTSNGGVGGGSDDNSPQSRFLSPWASVVRGDSEQKASPVDRGDQTTFDGLVSPENSELNGYMNGDRPVRSVWKSPSNGVEPVSVMGGAVSWPALSETTRPIIRSLSDNSRQISDRSASSSQDPIVPESPQQLVNDNPSVNNAMPMRPRSRNPGPSQHTFNPPPFPVPYFEVTYGMTPPVFDTSMRGPRPVNDHSQRNNSRRGGYGGRPYHNNHRGRHNQVRRDVHYPPHYIPPPMGYMPPPGMPPFVPPTPIRGFYGQMGFDMASPLFYMMPPPESFRSVAPSMLFPPHSNDLMNSIVKQIDFYFSNDNLAKDHFLRSLMNDQGWVSIHSIANFPRVQQLTNDIPMILDALRHSTVVEVQGENVRRRNEWKKWLNSHGVINFASSSKSPTTLATSLKQISLDDDTIAKENGNIVGRDGKSLPEELTGKTALANGDDTTE